MLEYGLYGKEISSSFNSAYTSISQKVKPLIIVDWLDSRHVDKFGNTEIASTTSTLSQPTSAFVQSSAPGMLANGRSLSEREIQFNRSRHANFYFTPIAFFGLSRTLHCDGFANCFCATCIVA